MRLSWDVNRMSSFSFRAIGCLARNPEMVATDKGTFWRFCLTSEDYTEDEQGLPTVTVQSIWLVATDLTGVAIADSARKRDQLFVEGNIGWHHWTANGSDEATLVVTGFRFGARSGGPGAASAVSSAAPNSPMDSVAGGSVAGPSYRAASIFSDNHLSTSERNHPPEE